MKNNSIAVISPYKWNTIWVFDDPNTGLEREAFVAGADLMMDKLTENIPNADTGFNLLFAAIPFPGYDMVIDWVEPDLTNTGNFYVCLEHEIVGWLCPALYKYFDVAPPKIYFKAQQINS